MEDDINDTEGFTSKMFQDYSSLYPILVKPWTVNKVTCGSLMTLIDNSLSDVTVSFDACLVALLLLNIFIFGPLLFADMSGQFSNIFLSFQDRIDRIENALGLENHFEVYKNPTFLENLISTMHNNTYLDTTLRAVRNLTQQFDMDFGNPMERLDDFSTFLQNFDTLSSTNDDSGEDLENEIDDNQYLISHRIPVSVYKYPIDGTFGGSMFQGLETLTHEVLDLSGASDKELKEFYSLPRSF